eukprot:TRINITY_DN13637_c0_g1_i1.p1 TRINITY_DN13637_c0_g1~~TRINITY_DN13637_c0_g1_i1.p1  ORF type:complete len:605 (-),score=83.06 TRINITY_DN13637_c0_g1_i1:163-1920(-)
MCTLTLLLAITSMACADFISLPVRSGVGVELKTPSSLLSFANNGTLFKIPVSKFWSASAVDVSIGTPPTSFQLRVDTLMYRSAVPSANCTTCSTADYYDDTKSRTAVPLDAANCPYWNGYSCYMDVSLGDKDQTRLQGVFISDTVQLGGIAVPNVFGQITWQNPKGKLADLGVDGILGFADYPNQTASNLWRPWWRAAVAQQNLSDVFSIFIGMTTESKVDGVLTLGGVDEAQCLSPVKYTPMLPSNLFTVGLVSISIGPHTLATWTAHPATVDTGQTSLRLDPTAFASFRSYMESNYCSLVGICGDDNGDSFWNHYCFSEVIPSQYPRITLAFQDSVEVTVYPEDYLIGEEYHGFLYWCLGIEQHDTTSLGAVVLARQYVVLDRDQNRVGFAPHLGAPKDDDLTFIDILVFILACLLGIAVISALIMAFRRFWRRRQALHAMEQEDAATVLGQPLMFSHHAQYNATEVFTVVSGQPGLQVVDGQPVEGMVVENVPLGLRGIALPTVQLPSFVRPAEPTVPVPALGIPEQPRAVLTTATHSLDDSETSDRAEPVEGVPTESHPSSVQPSSPLAQPPPLRADASVN